MHFACAFLVTLAVVLTPTFQEHTGDEYYNPCETKQYMFAEFESLRNSKGQPSCSSQRFQAGGDNCFEKNSFEGPITSLIDVSECTRVTFFKHTSCRTETERLVDPSRNRILKPFGFKSLNLTRINGCQKSLEGDRIYEELLKDSANYDELDGSFLGGNNKLSLRLGNLMQFPPNRKFAQDLCRLLE